MSAMRKTLSILAELLVAVGCIAGCGSSSEASRSEAGTNVTSDAGSSDSVSTVDSS